MFTPWTDIIDIHAHIGHLRGREHPPRDALARMDRNGIQHAVTLHFMTGLIDREDFRRANDYVLEALKSHGDRFVGMCVVSPLHGQAACDEVRRCLDEGMSAVKFHADKHGGYSILSPGAADVLRVIEQTGAVLFIHSDFHSRLCSPYQVAELARAFPKVRMILGHSGLDQERCGEAAQVVRDLPNVFLDTSQTPDNPEAVYVASTRTIGTGRVVFGSDAPVISPEVNLAKLRVAMDYFGLEKSVARAIVRGNALRLLTGAPNARL
jgi:uncharacterized protein